MKRLLKNIKQIILNTKYAKVHSFFDYSAKEKAKIIRQAVKESNKMQKDLVEEYDRNFSAA